LKNRYNSKDFGYYLNIFVLALLYFLSGKASLLLLNSYHIVSIGIFASEGIALAFALYFGKSVWPGIFLGQFILALYSNIDLLSSMEISAINSLEAIIGVVLFQKYRLDKNLKSFRDVIGLAIIIVFVLQIFSSLLSNLVLLFNSQIDSDSFGNSLFSWWFGNVMGQLLFTPFVLLLLLNYKSIRYMHYLLCGLSFSLFLYVVEIELAIKSQLLLLSLTIPIVIYAVSKKGIVYGMLFSVIIAFVSAYAVYLGVGIFYAGSRIDNTVNYNLFVLAHVVTVFTVSILFQQRIELEKNLYKKIEQEVAKNKEQQLLMMQQSRLAQMGEMIAMIAHQWRQPLNNLALANQLLISKYKKNRLDDETMEYFKENSKKQIDLMSTTIDDFRNFFKSEKNRENFCINSVIDSILDMTKAIYTTSGIKIDFHAKEFYHCYGYPNDLGQAILNIINNAKDALVESNIEDRKINISIERLDGKIVVSIADNAGGIPEEIIDKIFDPYFTTKDSKNGTGLGLYMTKMIIQEKLNANIVVGNENNGANFKIFLRGEEGNVK